MDVERLAEVTLEDHEGEPRRLGDHWTDQAVVVNFLRHFG